MNCRIASKDSSNKLELLGSLHLMLKNKLYEGILLHLDCCGQNCCPMIETLILSGRLQFKNGLLHD